MVDFYRPRHNIVCINLSPLQQHKQQQQKQAVAITNSRPIQDGQARTEGTQNSSTLQTVMVNMSRAV